MLFTYISLLKKFKCGFSRKKSSIIYGKKIPLLLFHSHEGPNASNHAKSLTHFLLCITFTFSWNNSITWQSC